MTSSAEYGELVARVIEQEWYAAGWPRPLPKEAPVTVLDTPGVLYLLHFTIPLGDVGRPRCSARHYVGWAKAGQLDERLAEHRRGAGARITAAAVAAGAELLLVWTAPGTFREERRRKKAGHHDAICHVCQARPLD